MIFFAIQKFYFGRSEIEALEIKEGLDMVERSTYSDSTLKYNFGYTEKGIKELRKDAIKFRW